MFPVSSEHKDTETMTTAIYYLKAYSIIARHPVRVLSHPKAKQILSEIAAREFRLHWLRDVARGS